MERLVTAGSLERVYGSLSRSGNLLLCICSGLLCSNFVLSAN